MFLKDIIKLRNTFLSIVLVGSAALSCTPKIQSETASNNYFYQNLIKASGKKLAGTIIYPAGEEAPFKGSAIWLEVNPNSKKEIRLPIHTGEKVYRTLILEQDEAGYSLKHENKKTDGTHAEISLYGGHTAEVSSPFMLYFEPDVFTRHLLGTDKRNWSLALSSDGSILSYIAEDDGRLMMQIDFDIKEPEGQFYTYGSNKEESPKLRKR